MSFGQRKAREQALKRSEHPPSFELVPVEALSKAQAKKNPAVVKSLFTSYSQPFARSTLRLGIGKKARPSIHPTAARAGDGAGDDDGDGAQNYSPQGYDSGGDDDDMMEPGPSSYFFSYQDLTDEPMHPAVRAKVKFTQWRNWREVVIPDLIQPYLEYLKLKDGGMPRKLAKCMCRSKGRTLAIPCMSWESECSRSPEVTSSDGGKKISPRASCTYVAARIYPLRSSC